METKQLIEELDKLMVGKDIDVYGNKLVPSDLLSKFEKIAKDILFIDTLETKYIDDKDFHEVAVWNIANALYEAYKLGQESVK